jgi:hypothetical protein
MAAIRPDAPITGVLINRLYAEFRIMPSKA